MKDHRLFVTRFCEQYKNSCSTCGFVSQDGKSCMLSDNNSLRQTVYDLVASVIIDCEPTDQLKSLRLKLKRR